MQTVWMPNINVAEVPLAVTESSGWALYLNFKTVGGCLQSNTLCNQTHLIERVKAEWEAKMFNNLQKILMLMSTT